MTTGLLIQLIVKVRAMPTAFNGPFKHNLSTRVIILVRNRATLPIKAFRCTLYRHRKNQGTMPPRLYRHVVYMLFHVFLVLIYRVFASS